MVDMENPGVVVALFDLDGTLCNARHLVASIVGYQFKNPARIPSAVIYLMTQVASFLLIKAGLLTYARVAQAGTRLARLLKGFGKNEILSLFSRAARTAVNTARQETLNLLRWHQERGHIVILVSGAFQPFLREVASLLGINHTVGTTLEEADDCYTGRLAGPFCHGDEKARLVRHFIEVSGFDVNLSSSYAYGDRVQDIPMLEMVGHSVAVYPDKDLLTYANERGWTVIGASVGKPPN